MRRRLLRGVALAAATTLALSSCSSGTTQRTRSSSDRVTSHVDHTGAQEAARPVTSRPLRKGEWLDRLAMPTAYTPSAPYGKGTDDYRCFLLDPHLKRDAYITGMNILPGQPKVVHHVILFRVPPSQVPTMESQDRAEKGEGWTCFGGTGTETTGGAEESIDDAPWLGAWAPGSKEQVSPRDVGVPLAKGSRVVMQVHYNLLAGPKPDVSSAQLRLADASKHLKTLRTVLLPAPVELPCRAGHDDGRLCRRSASVADTQQRFGAEVGLAANYLHFLCGPVRAGPVQTCDQTIRHDMTVRAVAGHMHLLGRSISVTLNPGTARRRTLLHLPVWDFDDQSAKPLRHPVRLHRGDTVRVRCRHDQSLRDRLPAFRGTQEKYVVWGEGTTDEMCLGLLLATRDS